MAKAYNGIKKKIADKIAKEKQKSITFKGYNTRLSKIKEKAISSDNEDVYTYIVTTLKEKTGLNFTGRDNLSKQDITPEQEQVLEQLIPGGRGYDYNKFISSMRERIDYEEKTRKEKEMQAWQNTANRLVKEELYKLFDDIYEDGPGTKKSRGILREQFTKNASRSNKTMMSDTISSIARKAASGEYTAYQLRQEIGRFKERVNKVEEG